MQGGVADPAFVCRGPVPRRFLSRTHECTVHGRPETVAHFARQTRAEHGSSGCSIFL